MKCPWCRKEEPLSAKAKGHVFRYGQAVQAACVHCKKPIAVGTITTIRLSKLETDLPEDDWGVEYDHGKT